LGNKAGAEVAVHLGFYLEEIADNKAICRNKKWQRYKLAVDTVVLATKIVDRTEVASFWGS